MKVYPRCKYHPDKEVVVVHSPEEEKKLGHGWYDSPADYGVETAPGVEPDPQILAKRKKPHGVK